MYNRYIRNDNGSYERMAQSDPPRKTAPQPPHEVPTPPPAPSPKLSRTPESHFFNRLLDKIHLGDIDSGDLLLLLILFLLFQENADEELLIAIGLLLIL